MDTQILKLEAPYEYIFCNGVVALHIATLIVYETSEDEEGEYQLEAHSHPIVKYKDRPGGTVWNKAELRDCEVLCCEDNMQISLKKFRKLLSRHPETEENDDAGTSLNPIWKRDLEDFGIKVAWPLGDDGKEHFMTFNVKLDIKTDGKYPFVCVDRYTDFFFYIEAMKLEHLKDFLVARRNWYYQIFKEHAFNITFTCDDKKYSDFIHEVNLAK